MRESNRVCVVIFLDLFSTAKMSKGVTVADAYAFELGDALKELAEKELRETAATRDFALTALREWIEANPRIASARLGECTFFGSHRA